MLRRPDLPSCRLLAAKHHTSRRRFRDQSVLLVGYVAFNVADGAAPLHNGSFRSELCLPDRAKEIDFQFDDETDRSQVAINATATDRLSLPPLNPRDRLAQFEAQAVDR